ncbi:MAG: thioredoxin family protein [Candidatus Arcticimaribacter sp.]
MNRIVIFCCFIFCVMGFAQNRTQPATQAQELGKVSWYRDFDQALALSRKQNKPIFVLFQEVPGCLTCRNYGKGVLSNAVIVKTIEEHFIPLAIFNNKRGKDNAVLKQYGEPSWNNPVVRIIDAKGENLIRRIAGDYSKSRVAQEMLGVLEKQQKVVSSDLRNLASGLRY